MFCKSVVKDLSYILLYMLATVIYLFFSNWVVENTHTPIWVDWKAPELMKYLASKGVWSRRKTALLLSPTLTASLFVWSVTPHAQAIFQGTLHSTTPIFGVAGKKRAASMGFRCWIGLEVTSRICPWQSVAPCVSFLCLRVAQVRASYTCSIRSSLPSAPQCLLV